ncbi:hypothetical protein O181_074261 [Austropuccinia psidii MF-1]|uniref:Uncharacterized protein n=1 Tax=Austropuccinia psidii MF-1 TaxID=1389203 RepID=A0A9Q3FCK5_9BASI|nr:hypothetical protein [Austropuccinia psidii MF-1]
MKILRKTELPKVKSLLKSLYDQSNWPRERLAQARRIGYNGPLSRSSQQQQKDSEEALQTYKVKAQEFINMFEKNFREVGKVDRDISLFVENHLPGLADFTSGRIHNKAEGLSISRGWTKLRQLLPWLKTELVLYHKKGDQLDLLKALASREEIKPEHVLDTINEMKIKDIVNELNRLLRKLKSLSINPGHSRDEHELSLASRLLLETYIFQALNFFYENQLCDQKVLTTFFSTENTLQRTYDHVQSLFKIRMQRGEEIYFTLMPELSFVLNDWNCGHLHNLLRDLDKRQQACLVELMLIGTIQRFENSRHFPQASPEIKAIMAAVTKDRILKHWWLNPSPTPLQKESADKWVLQLGTFFGEIGDSEKRFEFMISYYLYNFIKTYQIRYFPTLPFNNLKENMLLDSKYELFQAGIKLHEAVNRSFDYGHLVQLPLRQRKFLTTVITCEMVEDAETEMHEKAKDYTFIKENLERIAIEDQMLSKWLENNFYLRFYNTLPFSKERRNLWSYGQLPLDQIVSG